MTHVISTFNADVYEAATCTFQRFSVFCSYLLLTVVMKIKNIVGGRNPNEKSFKFNQCLLLVMCVGTVLTLIHLFTTVPPAPLLQLEPLNCTSIVARWQISAESVAVQGYRLCYHEEGHPEQPAIQLQAQNHTYAISGLGKRRRCAAVSM